MADEEWGVGNARAHALTRVHTHTRARARARARARKILRFMIYLPASLIRGATLFSMLYF